MLVLGGHLAFWAILCLASAIRRCKVQTSTGCSGTVCLYPWRTFVAQLSLMSMCSAHLQPVREVNDLGGLQACSYAVIERVWHPHLASRYPAVFSVCGLRFKDAMVGVSGLD